MKKGAASGVALLIALVLAVVAFPTAAQAATTPAIMVVGDSISQGSSGDYTWRYRLAKHLTANGWTLESELREGDWWSSVIARQ